MRWRITLFHKNENGIDPSSLKIAGRSISGPDIVAVREDRVTLALEELPVELQEILRESQELYIRWNEPLPHESIGPWNSRLPPGLHVFYTPRHGSNTNGDLLCRFLRTAFGALDCSSPSESFTRLPNDRFSHSTAYQYYQPLNNLTHFITYAEQYACVPTDLDCKAHIRRLAGAGALDFSYDAISHVVKVTALWPHGQQGLSIDSHPNHRVEVGIMTPDTPPHLEQHEIGVTGLLTVLGEDSKPSPTLFSFPSRHKSAGSSFSSDFLRPRGLHPTMQLRMSSSRPPPVADAHNNCAPHAYLTLPRAIFADKYQLGDALFLASKNLTALRHISQPVDLEAPAYALKPWGSSVLLELQPPSPPSEGEDDQPWTAEIPLHLRYLAPAEERAYADVTVPAPAVFWACPAADGTKFANSPFDRVNLGYDGLFGPRTLFWHVDPTPPEVGGTLEHAIQVPVLDLAWSAWVRTGTAAVVLLGFAFVVWKLVAVYARTGYGSVPKPDEKKKQ
ncbi:PIG-X [Xylariaceae sp. FL0662B]|nr:PIG-X [Xylariaceae sp. FL0662B]